MRRSAIWGAFPVQNGLVLYYMTAMCTGDTSVPTVAGHRLGTLEVGGGGVLPPCNASLGMPPSLSSLPIKGLVYTPTSANHVASSGSCAHRFTAQQ